MASALPTFRLLASKSSNSRSTLATVPPLPDFAFEGYSAGLLLLNVHCSLQVDGFQPTRFCHLGLVARSPCSRSFH